MAEQRGRGRPKGSRNKPKKPRAAKPATPSSATRRAMDQAEADSNSGINIDAFNTCARIYFAQEDKLDSFRGEYMGRCKGPRQEQAHAIELARDHGCPTVVTRLKLKLMMKDREKAKLRRAAETDTLTMLEKLERARDELGPLADTPLGQAHLDSVEHEATTEHLAPAPAPEPAHVLGGA